jgi:hypothetical protein
MALIVLSRVSVTSEQFAILLQDNVIVQQEVDFQAAERVSYSPAVASCFLFSLSCILRFPVSLLCPSQLQNLCILFLCICGQTVDLLIFELGKLCLLAILSDHCLLYIATFLLLPATVFSPRILALQHRKFLLTSDQTHTLF